MNNNKQHPVWDILNKGKYVEEFHMEAEDMYDLIKSIVNTCGNVTKDGNTQSAMKVFFEMWNEHSDETFAILRELVDSDEDTQNIKVF